MSNFDAHMERSRLAGPERQYVTVGETVIALRAALEAAEARAVRAEAALKDIPPTGQLKLWLKADLVALLGDLRLAGQEGKPE